MENFFKLEIFRLRCFSQIQVLICGMFVASALVIAPKKEKKEGEKKIFFIIFFGRWGGGFRVPGYPPEIVGGYPGMKIPKSHTPNLYYSMCPRVVPSVYRPRRTKMH